MIQPSDVRLHPYGFWLRRNCLAVWYVVGHAVYLALFIELNKLFNKVYRPPQNFGTVDVSVDGRDLFILAPYSELPVASERDAASMAVMPHLFSKGLHR